MTFRPNEKAAPQGALRQMLTMCHYLRESGLDLSLLELTCMRAFQINGCAFCLAMHAKALREAGEREDRLAVLPAWRETDWFSGRARAAPAWTEAVTTLEHREVPDDVFARARAEFGEQELADLTLAAMAVNGASRLNIAFHNPPVPFTIDANERVAAD